MFSLLISIFASLLPLRWRRSWLGDQEVGMKRGAIFSGVLELVGSGLTLWFRYPTFIHGMMAEAGAQVAARTANDRLSAGISDFSIGFLGLWVYILTPINLFLIYCCAEGALRTMAAVATSEVVPSMPLQLIAWLQGAGRRKYASHSLGPRLVDTVIAGISPEYDLRIDASRPKQWTKLTTIRYNDELFEVAKEMTGPFPHRYVYFLKRIPPGKVVRGLHDYDPEETLQPDS
ncbi:MAG TPA: hypothetical protein VFA60_05365 [Terriglobales bacterium]|nr:hypothetical protein [Terriglobales bacterium]